MTEPAPPVIACGDFDLNIGGATGLPSLIPSQALEQRLCLPAAGAEAGTGGRLGIHIHAFHPETLGPILRAISNVGADSQLLITTDSHAKQDAIAQLLAAQPLPVESIQVQVVANQGRNIAPLLQTALPQLRANDLLLHLHTKRSEHTQHGEAWLEDLLNKLVGSPAGILQLRQAFSADPQLGLVMATPPSCLRPYLNWGANFDLAQLLAHRAFPGRQLDPLAPLIFPAGMMFWCRPAVLEPLASCLHPLELHSSEPLLADGSCWHALERLTAHSCEARGYHWALIGSEPAGANASGAGERPAISVWQAEPQAYWNGVGQLAATYRHERRLHHHANESLQAEREQRRCQLEGLEEQLVSQALLHEQQLQQLEQRRSELERQLLELRHSLSWRVTGPLRRLSSALRRDR